MQPADMGCTQWPVARLTWLQLARTPSALAPFLEPTSDPLAVPGSQMDCQANDKQQCDFKRGWVEFHADFGV
jgi:hypothetical protein